jgi:hypothetical protein
MTSRCLKSGYVRTDVDGVPVVITPAGIDITTADRLRAGLLDLASGGHPTVIVDMIAPHKPG